MKKHFERLKLHLKEKKIAYFLGGLMAFCFLLFILFPGVVLGDRIFTRVKVGTVNIGGLTRSDASAVLSKEIEKLTNEKILLEVEGAPSQTINLDQVDLSLDAKTTIDSAWQVGRDGKWYEKMHDRISLFLFGKNISAVVLFNSHKLEREIGRIASIVDQPRKDIRLEIKNKKVDILYDTEAGKIIDRAELFSKISNSLAKLDEANISIKLKDDFPYAEPGSAPAAKRQAELMIRNPIVLRYEDYIFNIPQDKIASWVVSSYEEDKLVASVDMAAIEDYVTSIAPKLYIEPIKPDLEIKDGRVVKFKPPIPGKSLEQEKAVEAINDLLTKRKKGEYVSSQIALSVELTSAVDGKEDFGGIVELIGKATTPFSGSPLNRIHNIKNGVKFLSGIIIQPGEIFSTLNSLGTIDGATGYLPELVIKGDETTPEFGGGLCQVSTTLFRAVMNAGLPVLARRNHSYRVGYYEYDGAGKYIGPGLDATIYEPNLDFKFKNDSPGAILLYSYVAGDRVTFELYGTKDGRRSVVAGPVKLTETPSGDPIYTETDELPKGTTKQIEKPHPGGTTVATYTITYADGVKNEQKFTSYYRPWPAKFLVGTKE
jgi:vancomycin resistance protein YoaR